MDFFSNVVTNNLGGLSGGFNTSMNPLTKPQKDHMRNVYSTLAFTIITTAVGAYFGMFYYSVHPILCVITQIAASLYITASSPVDPKLVLTRNRVAALATAGFSTGCGLSRLLLLAAFVNPALIFKAFFLTMTCFTCFSLSAMYSDKRSNMYIRGVLGSAAFYLSTITLMNFLFRSRLTDEIILIGGLFLACGYIYYYTQKIIVDLELQQKDYVKHSMYFYLELVSVFGRILILLLESERKKHRDDKDRRSD
eukprot:Lankesteria_metandrocarpae@DN5019_c0_g1_i1.p1